MTEFERVKWQAFNGELEKTAFLRHFSRAAKVAKTGMTSNRLYNTIAYLKGATPKLGPTGKVGGLLSLFPAAWKGRYLWDVQRTGERLLTDIGKFIQAGTAPAGRTAQKLTPEMAKKLGEAAMAGKMGGPKQFARQTQKIVYGSPLEAFWRKGSQAVDPLSILERGGKLKKQIIAMRQNKPSVLTAPFRGLRRAAPGIATAGLIGGGALTYGALTQPPPAYSNRHRRSYY